MIDFIGNDIEKNTLYKNEIPYRMVCNMIKMYWPHQYKEELRKYGLMLIKPEAIIMGKASEIFSILHSAGYELIYFVRKKNRCFTHIRDVEIFLGKYQFGTYTYKSKAFFYI